MEVLIHRSTEYQAESEGEPRPVWSVYDDRTQRAQGTAPCRSDQRTSARAPTTANTIRPKAALATEHCRSTKPDDGVLQSTFSEPPAMQNTPERRPGAERPSGTRLFLKIGFTRSARNQGRHRKPILSGSSSARDATAAAEPKTILCLINDLHSQQLLFTCTRGRYGLAHSTRRSFHLRAEPFCR